MCAIQYPKTAFEIGPEQFGLSNEVMHRRFMCRLLDLGAIVLVAHMVAVSPSLPVRVSARHSRIVGVYDL